MDVITTVTFIHCVRNVYWLRAGRSGDRISVGVKFTASVQTSPGAHPASCTMGSGYFPGVKSGRGVTLTPPPPSSAVGHEGVELYLYSPYGPYGLYRASVSVQGWPLPSFYFSINFICFFVLINLSPAEADLCEFEEITLETGSVIDVKHKVRPQKFVVFSAPLGELVLRSNRKTTNKWVAERQLLRTSKFFTEMLTDLAQVQAWWMLYVIFWVIPRRLNFIFRRFGTLCFIFIGG